MLNNRRQVSFKLINSKMGILKIALGLLAFTSSVIASSLSVQAQTAGTVLVGGSNNSNTGTIMVGSSYSSGGTINVSGYFGTTGTITAGGIASSVVRATVSISIGRGVTISRAGGITISSGGTQPIVITTGRTGTSTSSNGGSTISTNSGTINFSPISTTSTSTAPGVFVTVSSNAPPRVVVAAPPNPTGTSGSTRTPLQIAPAGSSTTVLKVIASPNPEASQTIIFANEKNEIVAVAPDSRSGEIHTSIGGQLVQNSRFSRSTTLNRIRTATKTTTASSTSEAFQQPENSTKYALAGRIDAEPLQNTYWSQVIGGWHEQSATAGNEATSSALGGVVAGFDVPVFETWRVGLMGGYARSHTKIDALTSKSSTDSYILGAYARH